MKFNLKEGVSAIIETIVTKDKTALFYGSGNLEVFATPAMIALMENAAKSCVDLHIPSGYTTVGIDINVKHIKATSIGIKVKCEAVLMKVDNKKLYFNVKAWDKDTLIGEGTHIRYIVNTEKFMLDLKK